MGFDPACPDIGAQLLPKNLSDIHLNACAAWCADISNSSFVQFQIWDFPGQIDFFDSAFDSETIFGSCGALVFVIDAQDDYLEALAKLHVTVTKAYKVGVLFPISCPYRCCKSAVVW